ncbi:MAG: ribosome biogenesis GTP-binding protein YihA/YsxC [Oscillospiraceae bacterium]|nr:ribosome biogenesis GTP-binding protein YihA/YsxC [Oscillospiraceae bacterium]MDY3791462.1 ribosome biogenesis GTP-binding protein YihA/YsxC [Oscillospiraceae bacterium]MDY6208817.1 ribosome biogenesis GTP-binding protein YihA/YsxC [Oscillospiraceae bacterium]
MNFNKAEFFRSYGEYSQLPPSDRVEIAFAGRSNVGKSSLINKVFNRKNLARVSAVPGKTATINFYSLENIFLVDLPGYGYAKVAKSDKVRWSGLIEGYLHDDRQLSLIFQLIDMRHPPTKDDLQMIDFLIESEIPFAIVFTKADKLSKREREERMAGFAQEIPYFDDIEKVEFSAQTGEGAEKIRQIIEELADDKDIDAEK